MINSHFEYLKNWHPVIIERELNLPYKEISRKCDQAEKKFLLELISAFKTLYLLCEQNILWKIVSEKNHGDDFIEREIIEAFPDERWSTHSFSYKFENFEIVLTDLFDCDIYSFCIYEEVEDLNSENIIFSYEGSYNLPFSRDKDNYDEDRDSKPICKSKYEISKLNKRFKRFLETAIKDSTLGEKLS